MAAHFRVRWIPEIELDVADHVGSPRARADRDESLRVFRALRGDEDAVRQRLAEQADQPPVTRDRAWRDARASQHQWHAEPSATMVEIGPDLGLENDCNMWLHALEEASNR